MDLDTAFCWKKQVCAAQKSYFITVFSKSFQFILNPVRSKSHMEAWYWRIGDRWNTMEDFSTGYWHQKILALKNLWKVKNFLSDARKDEAAVKELLVPSLLFTDGLLPWKDGTRLTYTPESPLAAAEGEEEESGLGLESFGSEGLSWRLAGLGIKTSLGGGSRGTSGALLMGLVLWRGTGLNGTSLYETELSSSPSGRKTPGRD